MDNDLIAEERGAGMENEAGEVQAANKQTLRSENTKRRILQAAESVFSRLGFYGARIDEIAAAASTNKRMIYEYFGNKEKLYETVLEGVYTRLAASEDTIVLEGTNMDSRNAIRVLVSGYFEFLRRNESYVRMVMWENLMGAHTFDKLGLTKLRSPIRHALQDVIRHGQQCGMFRNELDDGQVLMTLFACTYNYFSNVHTMSRVMSADLLSDEAINARIENVADMLLTYMSKRN